MHGKWSEPDVPHKGWTCLDVEDLGPDESAWVTCEMCESQTIRYVHTMEHPEYDGTLGCGCVCAGNMEEDLVGARERERTAARKSRWLKRRWYRMVEEWPAWRITDTEYLNTDGYHISVYPRKASGVWGFTVTNRDTDYKLIARKPYVSREAAKLRAFDALHWLKARGL